MIAYVIVYFFNVSLSILEFSKKRKLWLAISFVVLSIFLNFAYTNGIDWTNYQLDYEYDINQTRGLEYGYDLIVYIGKFLNLNFEFFKFMVLTIDLYIIYKFLKKTSPFPLFSIVILFQTYLLGNFFEPAIRQIQSVVILLLSFNYLVEGKKSEYFLCICVATLFHNSSIILFLLYFLRKRKIELKELIIIIIISFLSSNVVSYLIEFTVSKISFLSDYNYYFDKYYFQGGGFSALTFIKSIIYIIPIFLLINYKPKDKKIILLHNISVLFIVTFIMQNKILILYRFNHFFVIFYVAYITNLFVKIKLKFNKAIIFVIFISLHIFSLYRGITYYKDKDPMKYYPYTNYIIEILRGDAFDSPEEKIYYRLRSKEYYRR